MSIKIKSSTRDSVEAAAAQLNKKQVAVEEKTAEQLRIDELVSEVISLKAAADDSKQIIGAYESAYKELKDYVTGADSTDFTFQTDDGTVTFGAASNKTEITDMAMVYKLLGKTTFLKVCTVPVSKLKDYLTKAELEKCTKTSRSGSRSLKAVIPAEK